uniref:Uncharacterized protein n=1 Tax=Glossina morsitans morsitans TaxID=37546 RepID=A0ABK9NG06_GLOMM
MLRWPHLNVCMLKMFNVQMITIKTRINLKNRKQAVSLHRNVFVAMRIFFLMTLKIIKMWLTRDCTNSTICNAIHEESVQDC